MTLGNVHLLRYLQKVGGHVIGQIHTDAKIRTFEEQYKFAQNANGSVTISKANGTGDSITLPAVRPLTPSVIAFFGLYSGDGAKGTEKGDRIEPTISFSQREPNLVRFAVEQFQQLFGQNIRFTYSLGEDSAFFMAGEGEEWLKSHYAGTIPTRRQLNEVRPKLNAKDEEYLKEMRNQQGSTDEHLAFYYQHKDAMQEILTAVKAKELQTVGIVLGGKDSVTASLRRPFKKGARLPGGSSRADEIHVGGLNGMGALFLKMLYELEESIYADTQASPQGLIEYPKF